MARTTGKFKGTGGATHDSWNKKSFEKRPENERLRLAKHTAKGLNALEPEQVAEGLDTPRVLSVRPRTTSPTDGKENRKKGDGVDGVVKTGRGAPRR